MSSDITKVFVPHRSHNQSFLPKRSAKRLIWWPIERERPIRTYRAPVHVTLTRTPNTLEAMISGEVDADNCHELTATIGDAISSELDSVIIDLTDLGFIDSSGISRLVELRQSALTADATFRIVNMAPNVRRVFEITGLLPTFGANE